MKEEAAGSNYEVTDKGDKEDAIMPVFDAVGNSTESECDE